MHPERVLIIVAILLSLFLVKYFLVDEAAPPTAQFSMTSGNRAVPGLPTLVDLSAAWCGPCRELKPRLLSLQAEYQGRVAIVIVDVDKDKAAAAHYNPDAYPTLVLHDATGAVRRRLTGAYPTAALRALLNDALAP